MALYEATFKKKKYGRLYVDPVYRSDNMGGKGYSDTEYGVYLSQPGKKQRRNLGRFVTLEAAERFVDAVKASGGQLLEV